MNSWNSATKRDHFRQSKIHKFVINVSVIIEIYPKQYYDCHYFSLVESNSPSSFFLVVLLVVLNYLFLFQLYLSDMLLLPQ
jgi:hypothetical protein